MRIGVNTRLFVKGKMDGIAWYACEILKRMVQANPEHEFVFFFDRKPNEEFIFAPNVKPVVVYPQARHPFLWILFFEAGIKRALKREKIDVFFSPDGWLCLGTKVKTLAVIHDLNFVHYPKFRPFLVREYYRFFFPRFAHRADALATVSLFSKNDIIQSYGVDPQKITIAYNGVSEKFFEIPQEEKKQFRNTLTGGTPYFVFVGTANRRKNIIRILNAFEQFRKNGNEAKLVFAGMNKYWDNDMRLVLKRMQFFNDIVFTGYIPTAELNRVLASSLALVYTSLFEGFGVPVLEAFACGVPVITSRVTSMPEVASDAALLVDPFSVDEIVQAMESLYKDEHLRNQLILKGKERVKLFTWEKPAEDLWKVIERLGSIS
ncbi:MAG: glycosyltransferase family 4 protein [Bacteroidales bacterium]|jgi:glycosyltransferase involved in cell wall biosynthesis|nr:glycosyltransferase family 4 protein [Bacteroidales bacterium]